MTIAEKTLRVYALLKTCMTTIARVLAALEPP